MRFSYLMATIRAVSIVLALAAFFLIGAPLQWFISHRGVGSRLAPKTADHIPILFCRSLLWLLGIRVAIDGTRATDGPVLMVANHVSWIDVLALGSVMPFCFLAKKEVAGWPIVSAFAEVQGTVFVDRGRRRSIPLANRQMAERMLEGRSVLFFPEGTTHAAMDPGLFRTSHFAAARDLLRQSERHEAIDVQPVAIAYSSADAAWVGDDALLPHIWRTLRAAPIHCVISFAMPIDYRADTNRKQVAAQSRDAIARRLGLLRSKMVARAPATRSESAQPVTGC